MRDELPISPMNRRAALAGLASAALVLAAAPSAPSAAARLAARRFGDVYVAAGWVLTARDVEDLGLHVA